MPHFHILCKDGSGGTIFRTVTGYKVAVPIGGETLFVYKDFLEYWVVCEFSTGMKVPDTDAETREAAVLLARAKLKEIGLLKWKQAIQKGREEHGTLNK